jgi:hypothetical protein
LARSRLGCGGGVLLTLLFFLLLVLLDATFSTSCGVPCIASSPVGGRQQGCYPPSGRCSPSGCKPHRQDGDRVILVAALRGWPTNPAWYQILCEHPEVVRRFTISRRGRGGRTRAGTSLGSCQRIYPPYGDFREDARKARANSAGSARAGHGVYADVKLLHRSRAVRSRDGEDVPISFSRLPIAARQGRYSRRMPSTRADDA